MVDGAEAVDCSDPRHDQHGPPEGEHGRGQRPTHAGGPSGIETGFSRIEIYGGRMDAKQMAQIGQDGSQNTMSDQHTFAMHTAAGVTGRTGFLPAMSVLLGLLMVGGCEATQSGSRGATAADAASVTRKEARMWMTIGEHRFAITIANNATVRAFVSELPLTVDMRELNGNREARGTAQSSARGCEPTGDNPQWRSMLYGKDTLVIFYETFNSSYSYTRLGSVDDPAGLAQALGRRGVRVVFSND